MHALPQLGGSTFIEQVDAETDWAPAHFMINCAHRTHLTGIVDRPGGWVDRIRGLRAIASRKSHAELDEAETLDECDPVELAEQYGDLAPFLPNLTIVGGCCGTDARHVDAVCAAFV